MCLDSNSLAIDDDDKENDNEDEEELAAPEFSVENMLLAVLFNPLQVRDSLIFLDRFESKRKRTRRKLRFSNSSSLKPKRSEAYFSEEVHKNIPKKKSQTQTGPRQGEAPRRQSRRRLQV